MARVKNALHTVAPYTDDADNALPPEEPFLDGYGAQWSRAASAPPGFGTLTVPSTGAAAALAAASTIVQFSLILYPDPNIDIYIAKTAITSPNAATGIMRAGGAPWPMVGPVDLATLFVLGVSGSPVITWLAQ